MADKQKQKGVFVDFTSYPELYEALMSLSEKEYTRPPAIIRQMVSDGIETRKHLQALKNKVQKEIRQVVK